MSTSIERAEVRCGHTPVAYAIRRSSRRGTVSIVVSPQQGVVLRAPASATRLRLAQVVRLKAPWILRQLRRQSGSRPVSPKQFLSGETFLYLGRQYRLRVVAGTGEAKLKGAWLVVPQKHVRPEIVAWYRRHAQEQLPDRVTYWAERLRLPVPQVLVRGQAMRWGSCDSQSNLRLNWRIIQAPMPLIDYVIAHELVHLRHRNHDATFWRALGAAMPDYQQRRVTLKLRGPMLEW